MDLIVHINVHVQIVIDLQVSVIVMGQNVIKVIILIRRTTQMRDARFSGHL
jgi:hypothetical protein